MFNLMFYFFSNVLLEVLETEVLLQYRSVVFY